MRYKLNNEEETTTKLRQTPTAVFHTQHTYFGSTDNYEVLIHTTIRSQYVL
jgi:hypothetical protein